MKPKNQAPIWRPAAASDLTAMIKIAYAIHPDLPERPEVFAEKFELFSAGCFVLTSCNEIVGYGLSHPWVLNDIPPLDTFLRFKPPSANCLYVHDVVILPSARGHASAGRYIDLMTKVAANSGLDFLALVSVYETHTLWRKYTFNLVSDPKLVAKLESYGAAAKYMIRDLRFPYNWVTDVELARVRTH